MYIDHNAEFIVEVMSSTGISLDPDFTAKAVRGMLLEMKERPEIFKGNRILFVHTGRTSFCSLKNPLKWEVSWFRESVHNVNIQSTPS